MWQQQDTDSRAFVDGLKILQVALDFKGSEQKLWCIPKESPCVEASMSTKCSKEPKFKVQRFIAGCSRQRVDRELPSGARTEFGDRETERPGTHRLGLFSFHGYRVCLGGLFRSKVNSPILEILHFETPKRISHGCFFFQGCARSTICGV